MSNGKRRRTRLHDLGDLPALTDDQIAEREAQNVLRQHDRLTELVQESVRDGSSRFRLRSFLLGELQAIAIDGLERSPGTFRTVTVTIEGSGHQPPLARDVPRLVDDLCDYVNDNWDTATALHLGAYAMWRTNWIHPFVNGNGRTSRAISYLVFSIKLGHVMPGYPTIPDLIARAKQPYYRALEAADDADLDGRVDVSEMERLLEHHLATQLLSVLQSARESGDNP